MAIVELVAVARASSDGLMQSLVAMAWSPTSDEVSHSERGSGSTTQRRWKVALMVFNAARSSPRGVVAAVCSSLITIRLAASSYGKKVVKPDKVLRFVMPGPRLRVPDEVTSDGLMSGPSGYAMTMGCAAEGSGSLQIRP
jgi:hypothetical protein